MDKVRHLLRNINLLNVLLGCVLIAVAYLTFFPHSSVKADYRKTVAKKTQTKKKPADSKTASEDEKNPSPADYMVIADENLFNPDRKIPEKKNQQKQAAKKLPKPEFVLDGTLITKDLQIAFMEDKKAPVNTPGRPNRQTPLKIGDSMSGYTLMKIDKDKVIMQRGTDKMTISLETPEKKGPQQKKAINQLGRVPGPNRRVERAPGRAPTPAQQRARKNFFNVFRSRRR